MAPSLTTAPTILTLKQNFLTTQTRLLAQPAEPSRAWRRGNHDNNDNDGNASLPERALDDALYRLNHTIQQHARRVYASQATRHVAEQIDRLYLRVGERPTRIGGGGEHGMGEGVGGGAGAGGDDGEGEEHGGEGGDEDAEGDAESWRWVGADYGEFWIKLLEGIQCV